MIRRDEGYALPFVLVVLLVLVALAVAIMDTSLRNLESQKATIQRMQEKYAAAAKIEEICAAAETKDSVASFPKADKAFLFLVEAGKLKVAAAGREDGDVWIIAELKPENSGGDFTETFSNGNSELTVKGSGSNPVSITTYQVVDKETAKTFITPGGAG